MDKPEMYKPKMYKPQILILIISSITIMMIYHLGLTFNMDKIIHARHLLYSIPSAVSYLYHGASGYTIYEQILGILTKNRPELPNSLITEAINFTNLDHSKIMFFPSDDKGTMDFVVTSFFIFGPKVESLYKGFFFILIVSAILFFLQYRKHVSELLFLPLFLLSLYLMTRMFLSNFNNHFSSHLFI